MLFTDTTLRCTSRPLKVEYSNRLTALKHLGVSRIGRSIGTNMVKFRRLIAKTFKIYRERGFATLIWAAYSRIQWNVRERVSLFFQIWTGSHLRRGINLRRIRRFQDSDGKLRLHIGCGSKRLSDYVNIDKYPTSGADFIAPAHRLRLPSGSVDEVYTSHMIEHLCPSELELALHEWCRVLKVGGKLRIRCPNFELYVREWLEGDYEYRWGWGLINIFGHDNRGEGLLTRNGFTRDRLDRLLSESGFKTLHCEVTETRPEFKGTIEYRPKGDLYYEGVKINRMKVLYVDALSEPTAQANVNGISQAYQAVSILKTFDYRKLTRTYGRFLMNLLLIQAAIRFQPDLIHLGKSESIKGTTIRKIKEKTRATIIHFYGDFRWEPRPWVVDIGRHADLTLLYHKSEEVIQKHRDRGIKCIDYWWVGTDPEIFHPREVPRKYDVVFMANNSNDFNEKTGQGYGGRQQLIDAIAAEDIHMHLFGKGWEYLSSVPTVHLHPFVDCDEFAEACSAAKITLGYNTNQVYMYTSWRRPLNSMACGAFHLTRYFPGLEEVFENGKHLVWFHSIPEAIDLIQYYLAHDDERERIAQAGRKEVLARHTWDHRIAKMLQYYEEYKS